MTIHTNIAIEKIVPNRHQPRLSFNDESLLELALSIKENGLIQPIVVREVDNHYEIIAGERRYRAMMMTGFTEIPVIINDMSDKTSATVALIENIQREDLNVVDEAKAYKEILRLQGITQNELAKRLGKSQSSIANKIRLLDLPQPVLNALSDKKITERHARALIGVDEEKTSEVLDKILNEKLNVQQTEKLIDKPRKKAPIITKGISQHIKIGINTIKQSIGMIEKTGIKIDHDMQEKEDEVIITIRFPK